jgi:hypothetical protein
VLCIHFDVTYSGNRDNIPSDARPLAPNESLLELIDYCFRKVNMMNLGRFNTFIDESNQVDLLKETSEQSLTRQEFAQSSSAAGADAIAEHTRYVDGVGDIDGNPVLDSSQ